MPEQHRSDALDGMDGRDTRPLTEQLTRGISCRLQSQSTQLEHLFELSWTIKTQLVRLRNHLSMPDQIA